MKASRDSRDALVLVQDLCDKKSRVLHRLNLMWW